MSKSILQNKKECYITERTDHLHQHHIYGGSRRQISDKNGFWVYLTADYHNMSDKGVHFNRELDLMLKRTCQLKYEETHSHEAFMALIGKNYL